MEVESVCMGAAAAAAAASTCKAMGSQESWLLGCKPPDMQAGRSRAKRRQLPCK